MTADLLALGTAWPASDAACRGIPLPVDAVIGARALHEVGASGPGG